MRSSDCHCTSPTRSESVPSRGYTQFTTRRTERGPSSRSNVPRLLSWKIRHSRSHCARKANKLWRSLLHAQTQTTTATLVHHCSSTTYHGMLSLKNQRPSAVPHSYSTQNSNDATSMRSTYISRVSSREHTYARRFTESRKNEAQAEDEAGVTSANSCLRF